MRLLAKHIPSLVCPCTMQAAAVAAEDALAQATSARDAAVAALAAASTAAEQLLLTKRAEIQALALINAKLPDPPAAQLLKVHATASGAIRCAWGTRVHGICAVTSTASQSACFTSPGLGM